MHDLKQEIQSVLNDICDDLSLEQEARIIHRVCTNLDQRIIKAKSLETQLLQEIVDAIDKENIDIVSSVEAHYHSAPSVVHVYASHTGEVDWDDIEAALSQECPNDLVDINTRISSFERERPKNKIGVFDEELPEPFKEFNKEDQEYDEAARCYKATSINPEEQDDPFPLGMSDTPLRPGAAETYDAAMAPKPPRRRRDFTT